MKKIIFFLIVLSLICSSRVFAQNYIASDYWKMEHDSVYNSLKKRQTRGDTLSVAETEYLFKHKSKLDDYFEKMPDSEKSSYYKNRVLWESQPPEMTKITVPPENEIFMGERSTFTRYLVSSGIFGLIYGGAAVAVFGMEEGSGAVAVPLLTAGASTLIPLLSIKDQKVTYNSLQLSQHGKIMGLFHGAALTILLGGESATENDKLIFSMSALTSIGLGRLGYVLGRDKPWTQGRVDLYSLYGGLIPFEALALTAALNIDEPRLYGLTFLAGGAGGYLLADHIARQNDFTPGDVTATGTLAVMNGLLGLGIIEDIASQNEEDLSTALILIPAAGALGGSLASHYFLRDAKLTYQQGRNTALASTGGAVIGLGIAALFQSESVTPYYVIPYLTGMSSYAIILNKYKKSNQQQFLRTEKDSKWKVNFTPQNIFLNQKFASKFSSLPGRQPQFLPAFSASCNF